MEKLDRLIGLTFIAAVFAAGCSDEPAAPVEETSEVAQVIAMNHPLLYFARRLSGGAMEVKLLAPLGTDPAQWTPEVADVLTLQAADLILLNGAGYEGWLDKVSISAGKLVDTSAAFRDRRDCSVSLRRSADHRQHSAYEHQYRHELAKSAGNLV